MLIKIGIPDTRWGRIPAIAGPLLRPARVYADERARTKEKKHSIEK